MTVLLRVRDRPLVKTPGLFDLQMSGSGDLARWSVRLVDRLRVYFLRGLVAIFSGDAEIVVKSLMEDDLFNTWFGSTDTSVFCLMSFRPGPLVSSVRAVAGTLPSGFRLMLSVSSNS
mmetsp:Transcript_46345/g.72547  ORF Transcript_46345/g.72547 Transcript_46345/m.72547 type:complete len:117 (+) Transcript_46345:1709-2059(+)